MSVEIFKINSGATAYKYSTVLGIPGLTGLGIKGTVVFDNKQIVNVSSIENKYSGTISVSGGYVSQSFG